MPIVVPPLGDQKGLGSPTEALPGSGTSAPAGLEAHLEYNGLKLGDSTTIDKFRVIDIDGLHDADIRDSRDNNPASHGETAFTAYYGGRTIAIRGVIEAHNIAKLRDMQQALRTAFSDLEEKPLYFRMGDSSMDHYIECRKSSPINMGETQSNSNNYFREFLITLRASDPRFKRVKEQSVILYPNLLPQWSFEGSTSSWTGQSLNMTSPSVAASATWASEGTKSMRVYGTSNTADAFVGAYYISGPNVVTAGETYTVYANVNVTNATTTGGARILVQFADAGLGVLSTEATSSTGTSLGVTSLSGTFTAPANASRFYFYIRVNTSTNADTLEVYFDEVMLVKGSYTTSPPGRKTISNGGSFESEPRIRPYGALVTPYVVNDTSDQSFIMTSTLGAGTYVEADIAKRTLLGSDGLNKFGSLNVTSDWPALDPGDNVLYIHGSCYGTDSSARIEVYYQDAWI